MDLNIDRIRNRLGIISVFWIIVTSGGVYFNTQNITSYVLIFNVILVLSQFMLARRSPRILDPFMLFVLFILCVLASIIANADYASYLSYMRLALIIMLALGTRLLLTNVIIVETFVKIVVSLAAISLIFFYSEFADRYASLFPVIKFYEHNYVNAFVYVFIDSIERRNFSIYIEPGLYQIYLNVALFALLYSGRKYRYGNLAIGVLLASIYTTQSTTGYILGLLIVSGHVFNSKLRKNNIISLASKVAVVILAVGFVLSSEFFASNLVEKFSGSKNMSFVYRTNASIVDFQIIIEHPLTGVGVGNYQRELDNSILDIEASANTFSQLGAYMGLPFVLLILWRVGVFINSLKINLITKSILAVVYVISFSTQPFMLFTLFYLPVFMSYRIWQAQPEDN